MLLMSRTNAQSKQKTEEETVKTVSNREEKAMNKKVLTLTLILVILTSAILLSEFNMSSATTATPTSLKIYAGPTSVLADNGVYNCIFVQLQDSTGKPARATEDTTISLASSQLNVGTIDSTIIIPENETYASSNFNSTLTAGSTTITASASGYSTVQATITTVTPIPSAIAVFGFPSKLPADGGTYPAIMVQLQDSSGQPQKAPPGGVDVRLSCSQLSVGTVSPEIVTIPYGSSYAIANFTTTTTPSVTPATITTQANGYTSKTVQITTKNVTTSPKNLVIYVGPPQILADNSSYPQVAVELQDLAGNIAAATSNLTITLSSSELSIGMIDESLVIGPQSHFQTYSIATFNTTFKAGTTTIYALASDLNGAQQQITTIEYIPPKLAVFAVPPVLPADKVTHQTLQVQLQDSRGRPARNLADDVIVNLFSQHPEIADINPTISISSGKMQATASITTTNSPGTTMITATTSGYTTGQTQVTTNLVDYTQLLPALTTNTQTLNSGNIATLTANVTGDGVQIAGATVTFTSDNGGTFTTVTEKTNGYYTTNFTAPNFSQSATCTITATAAKTGYLSGQEKIAIVVFPALIPTSTPTPSPTPKPTPTPSTTPNTNNTGQLSLYIKDVNEEPLVDAIVTSTTEPAGATKLFDITNATGYVTFQNVSKGSYTLNITKQGYKPNAANIDFTGQSLILPLTLLSANSTATGDNTLLIVLIVIIIIVISASLLTVLLIRRRNDARIRKLQELQKQLKQKY
jgi:hypothetical protein